MKEAVMEKCLKIERDNALKQFTRQIEYVKKNGLSGGLCSDLAEITGGSENLLVSVEQRHDSEINVKIPFAGTTLTVYLLFYLKEPWTPPEISFNDVSFMMSISAKELEEQVPALNNWNCTEEDLIAQLLHQLLQLYKTYQLEKLEHNDVLQFEYQSLLKTLDIGEGDIEVVVSNMSGSSSSLLVRLPLSLQDVPPVLIDSNPGQTSSLLQVIFQSTEGVFVPKLHLSPRVEQLIGGAKTLILPSVPPGTCLIDYVERILELLEQRVKRFILCFETRKQFIAQVLCQFGCAVIEYDAKKFTKVVLLCELNDFHFLIFVTLDAFFPQQQAPKVVLQSLYHHNARGPYTMELKELPFNSQWNTEEMVSKMKQGVLSKISSFQTASIRSFS
ncbi:BRISC and BRCA1-A complex member 2-like isoform X1 [Palaemon carinicauda]|uniref:BRISC and BRCA1-A complex member 2-like isoform X1 n=1 Tax=Palaemon carinicauda TaxID=392227 RepID=UPI0035B6AB1C